MGATRRSTTPPPSRLLRIKTSLSRSVVAEPSPVQKIRLALSPRGPAMRVP